MKKKKLNRKKNRKSSKKIFYIISGFIITALIVAFLMVVLNGDSKENVITTPDGFKVEIFEYQIIEATFSEGQAHNQGFNQLYLTNENGEKTTIIDTHHNLKVAYNADNQPYFKINEDTALLAIYSYTENQSKDLKKEDRIRNYEAEYITISKDGTVLSLGVSDKVFVDLYEKEGELFLEEKMYLDGYTHIPSWDRPHRLYTYKVHSDKLELVDEKDVFEF